MGARAAHPKKQKGEGALRQYEIWWATLPDPIGRRPVLLLSRDQAYEILNRVTVAEISTTIRGIAVEVALGKREGLPRACVANLDNIHALALRRLVTKIGRLSPSRERELERALGYAWDIGRLKDD